MQIEIVQAVSIVMYIIASMTQSNKQVNITMAWFACAFHLISSTLALGGTSAFALNAVQAINFSTAILVLGFLVSSIRNDILIIGKALYPFAATGILIAMVTPKPHGIVITPGIMAHILISVVAFSIMALAAVEATLIQLIRARLKKHKVSAINKMIPPLQTLEAMLMQTIRCGLIILSAAILTGAYFVEQFFSLQLIPKTTLTLMAWLLFSILLIGHSWFGWAGRVVTRVTLTGYFLLLLGFIGVKWFFNEAHL